MGKYKTEHQNQLTKERYTDAGLDIRASESGFIAPYSSALIRTGLYIAIPFGHVGLIWSRSGLACNNDIEIGAGCIDSNYRGEVKVLLRNHGDESFYFEKGARIAQLLTIKCELHNYQQVDDLDATDRGNMGWGSSGLC